MRSKKKKNQTISFHKWSGDENPHNFSNKNLFFLRKMNNRVAIPIIENNPEELKQLPNLKARCAAKVLIVSFFFNFIKKIIIFLTNQRFQVRC